MLGVSEPLTNAKEPGLGERTLVNKLHQAKGSLFLFVSITRAFVPASLKE